MDVAGGVPLPPGAVVAPERERGHSDGRRQGRKAVAVLEGHGPGGAPARMAVRGRVSGVWGSSWRGQGVEGWLGWLGFERRPEAAMAAMVDPESSSSSFGWSGGS